MTNIYVGNLDFSLPKTSFGHCSRRTDQSKQSRPSRIATQVNRGDLRSWR